MLAQYSLPFCVALALYRDPRDPRSFDEGALADPAIRDLCRRIGLVPVEGGHGAGASGVTVEVAGGRRLEKHVASGMLEKGELEDKFLRLCWPKLGEAAVPLYNRLMCLEEEDSLDWLTGG
jgi:hypothetical protein